jgi:tripartite ATP-independent transporter DctM subunit
LLGIATPTESAATGAIGALIVTGLYRRLNFGVLKRSLLSTLKLTGMIFFIFAGSVAFSQLLAISGATRGLLHAVLTLDVHPMMMFAIMQFIILMLGCFLDQNSIIMIAIPIYNPVVGALKFNPVWFWLIFLINITVGGITPPFGLVLFVMNGVSPDIPLSDIYKGAIPFVFLITLAMIVICFFPSIALWLPNFFFS